MEFEELRNTWEASKSRSETQLKDLTMEQLTAILNERKDSVTAKMKMGIQLSIGMNLFLLAGAIAILISFGADTISLVAGLTSAIVLVMSVVFAIEQYRIALTLDSGSVSLRETLMNRISFFKVGYRWIVKSIALSGAFVYILGSTTYLNLKYGQIVLDTDDIIVNVTAIILALTIGLISNTKEHNHYLAELESCLSDLDNKKTTFDFGKEQAARRRKYIYLAVFGLMLLVLMILYFWKPF